MKKENTVKMRGGNLVLNVPLNKLTGNEVADKLFEISSSIPIAFDNHFGAGSFDQTSSYDLESIIEGVTVGNYNYVKKSISLRKTNRGTWRLSCFDHVLANNGSTYPFASSKYGVKSSKFKDKIYTAIVEFIDQGILPS